MSARRVRAVTFDATGTLIHAPRMGAIYSEVLARHGWRVEPAAAGEMVTELWREASLSVAHGEDRFAAHPAGARGWWHDFLIHFCARLGGPPPSRFAAAELFDRFARAEAWEVYADAPPTLETLRRRGLRLAVVANWDERLPALLAALGLGSFFECVVTSQAAGVEKPHPSIFRTALGWLDLEPEEVLHVGDRRLEDVEGAEALGAHALLLDRGGREGGIASLEEVLTAPGLPAPC